MTTPAAPAAMFRDRLKARLETCGVPEHLHRGIVLYLTERRPMGSFLMAVVRNNLTEAVSRTDDETLKALQSLITFFYNYPTKDCWGSARNVERWLADPHPPVEVCE